MSLLSDVQGLKKPDFDIAVSGADFELDFIPSVGATISSGGLVYQVNSVSIVLGAYPVQVFVVVSVL